MPSPTDKTKNNKQHKHHDSLNNNEKRKDPWFNKVRIFYMFLCTHVSSFLNKNKTN